MGNKLDAKIYAQNLGIPVLNDVPIFLDQLEETASSLPYPVLIKSSHGGGGKGMQIVQTPNEMIEKATTASRMALNYFGNGDIYTEPFIVKARHIEVQILGDSHGNLVHLYERDCTLQRNYQKIIEEAPAPGLSEKLRESILDSAIKIGHALRYTGAGTVEFLLDESGRYYFMEMNPRIQVEHPVTEEITGIDIVREQILIVSGMPLSFQQNEVKVKGHSLEVRIYSEDPWNDFAPSTIPVSYFSLPYEENIRLETDLSSESKEIGSQFDPLLCKIIATGTDRNHTYNLMVEALQKTIIAGPATNQRYLHSLLTHPKVMSGDVSTRFCEEKTDELFYQAEQLRKNIATEFPIAAYLFQKFMPIDPGNKNPWKSQVFVNQQHEVEITIDDTSFIIPVNIIHHTKKYMYPHAVFHFQFNGKEMLTEVTSQAENVVKVTIDGHTEIVHWAEYEETTTNFFLKGNTFTLRSADLLGCYPKVRDISVGMDAQGFQVRSPLHGKVIDIKVQPEQVISKGDLLLVIEAMKSENHIIAHTSGRIKSIDVSIGTQVYDQMTLITLDDH
jgi:acetyl/propionyl-CoA carboxylase alpha subunit